MDTPVLYPSSSDSVISRVFVQEWPEASHFSRGVKRFGESNYSPWPDRTGQSSE
jgi:hypothetical protein